MTPEKLIFDKAKKTYRKFLINEVNKLLEMIPDDSEITLISPNSVCGIATGVFTDVVTTMNGKGMGYIYSSTDLDKLAYGHKLEISKMLNIDGLENLIKSIYNHFISQG